MHTLTDIQRNILIASIIADGEITKIYKQSRRKNHSYREHYGKDQENYRKWKISFFNGLLYLTPKSNTVHSKSLPLFTKLYSHFYDSNGIKILPSESILKTCLSPYFLAILYMDDGSLCISTRINNRKKLIYLTPHIYLYLQCYQKDELTYLQNFIKNTFNINFRLSSRKDGNGYILKTTSVKETFQFLNVINSVNLDCPSMLYKTSWDHRIQIERTKWVHKYPSYTILTTDSDRFKNYSKEEINTLIILKNEGVTINEIAKKLNRSYWSVVYKWSEIKEGL
ncbi:DNA endonuclease [Cytobacillus oceanisediminis]|uniref:DNA endonuclease n=1 Tax=Cytobacillus oceanisediminis TaxID=665099 RepID=UPI001CCD979E|nr:DNA endonuclease [Cytobacillus oceanisediminis]MBZ9535250.1 DNA endonuclease [Cytobacillus oceanisediminis]